MPTTAQPKAESRSGTALSEQRYAQLKRDVHNLATTADRATNHGKVVAFHQLGRRIARERLKQKSGYHNAVLRDLATDTPVSLRNLQYAVAFLAAYARPPARGLSWAHYRILLDRPDATSRSHYEALARTDKLTSPELAKRIRQDARAASGDTHVSGIPRPTDANYLYRATVENIVDGDTMDLRIDLGFHVDRRGRFRLADIDTPELPSPTSSPRRKGAALNTDALAPLPATTLAARAARDFVFQRLATAKTIVVKTLRTDLHGRYVAHLFYTDHDTTLDHCFREGIHLNAELLEAGHAVLSV